MQGCGSSPPHLGTPLLGTRGTSGIALCPFFREQGVPKGFSCGKDEARSPQGHLHWDGGSVGMAAPSSDVDLILLKQRLSLSPHWPRFQLGKLRHGKCSGTFTGSSSAWVKGR